MANSLLTRILKLRNEHFLKQHSRLLYDYQTEVSDRIITALVDNELLIKDADPKAVEKMESQDIPVEISRQSGKTEVIVLTVEFIMLFFPDIFDADFPIGIFAPQKEQAKTDFDRLKNFLMKTQKKLVVTDEDTERRTKEENNARTVAIANGASCFIAPITKASLSESKTFKLMIFEESQDRDDRITEENIYPMGASTNAPRVHIGTAGITECTFKKMVDPAVDGALVYDWKRVAKDRRKVYQKTKDLKHLLYERFVKNEIAKRPLGEMDDAIRRPYGLVWLTEKGMFVTKENLHRCRINKPYENGCEGCAEGGGHKEDCLAFGHDHYFGIDQAKHVDQTVLKIGRVIDNRLTVVQSFEMQGVDYPDQFDAMKKMLERYKIAAGAIDSTGQGDYMPDQFRRSTRFKVFPVTFSQQSKDGMYKSVDAKFQQLEPSRDNIGLGYYWDEQNQSAREFEKEMLTLIREYKGTNQYYLSVHHPNEPGAHDDHPDALALLVYAYDNYNQGSGILQWQREKRDTMEESKEELNGSTGINR